MSDYRVEPNGSSVYANMVALAQKDQRIAELEAEIMDLEATLRAIVHQCEIAGDPEHMKLGLVKNIAKAAIDNVMLGADQ
jgi:hypothetical protein